MNDQEIEESYPLTPLQSGMLFHSLYNSEAGMYIQQMVGELHEHLNTSAFQQAWQQMGERYAVLRTSFLLGPSGQSLQVVHRRAHFPFDARDWRDLSVSEQRHRLDDYLKADRRRGFVLTQVPLMRLVLFRLGEAEYCLVWTSHHALLDGRSRLLLLQELFALYEAYCSGDSPRLETPRSFKDHVDWLSNQDFSMAQRFWRSELEGVTLPTPIGIDGVGVSETEEDESYGSKAIRLSGRLTLELKNLAEKHELTLNTLLQGAWALLLGHYCGKDDVVFGTTRACRRSALKDAESMIGLFINTVPLRVRIPPEIPLIPWLKKLRLQWIGLRDYEHTPLSQIQDCIPDRGSSPLFESLLVFENFELNSALRSHSKGFENREFRLLGRTNYPLVITGCFDQQILLRAEYDSPRFSAKSIEHLLGHLETLLEAMVAVPSRQISDLPFLTEKEKEQLLVGWNATSVQYPREHCIHDLFESRVKTAPNAIALKFGERVLTYQQLNANANRLAHYLKKAGIGTGSMVGICMERTPNLTVAMLGVLKAGGAYVPIDPAYPPERQAFMLDDTGTRLLLTEAAQQESLTRHVAKLVGLDTDWNLIAKESDQDPTCDAQADSLAYVIYTSGSTGRPKGVAVTHRGIVRLLFGIDYVRLGPNERILHLSSISFDASTFEVWGALLHGAQLVIFPDRIPTLRSLEYELKTHPISLLWLTSSLFNLVIDENPEILSGVRQIVTGGEALSVRHIARALKVLPSTRIINGYGPTENTTFTCCYPIPREFNPHSISVPIGRPISNTRTFVLDSHLRPLPIGVTGELYTSGEGLAQGYLNQPLMTAEKFIPDPFSGKPGARMYRTGDMARYLPDGNLEFRGRRDEQVKIRGFRIELGEIEATLSEHPSVLQTVATANQGPDGVKSLVAYFVARGGQPPPVTKELRQFLEKKLPEYMIPARFVHLDSIPLTSNGKVDRTRLPAPGTASPDSGKIFVAARNSVEKRLLEIWSQILKKERIGIHDNFFDLGGESLLAVSMASQVRSILGIDLPVRKIFDEPTIAGLAEWIEREQANGQQVEEAPLRAVPRDREIPLSFKQEFCWSRKSIYFDRELLNICRIFRLRGNLQTANLQRAFNELIVRHESLRTSIALSPKGQPIQVINPEQEIVVPVVDLGFLAPADQQIEARHLAEEEGALIFKPNISPLLRAKLIRLSEDENWLVFVISHLIADGWSLRVLFRELGTIYSAYCRGEEPHLSPLPIQFADYAVWQRQHFQGQRSEELVSYWRHRLGKSLSSLKLPYDHSRPSTPTYLARRESVTIPAALQRSFSKLVKEEQTTEFVGLLAAFKLLLYLYTGQSDIVVGLPVSNRDQVETADVIGWFSNMVFCRSDLSGDPTFLSLLNRVRKTVLEDFQHRGLCIELLQLNVPPTDGSIDPISQCRFVEAPDFEIDLPMEKLQVELLSREQVSMANELRLYVGHKSSNGIELKVDYSTDLFAPETVRLMMRRYRELLEQIVTNPAKHISEYSLDSSPGKKETTSPTHTAYENISAIPMASLLQATHSSGEAERSPLSFAQQRLWFFDQLEPGKSAYNVNQLLRLRGPLQVEALERAFNAIIDRHAALRTTFATQNGEPVQVIARSLEITIPIIDFERFEVGRRRIEAQQRAEKEAERPFDLSRGPLIRVTLLRLAPIEHLLLLSMHHIVSDAWSMLVLQKELSAYYSGFISGEPVRLPPLPIQYADYAIWQRQRLQGKNLKADLDYWKQHLSGCASVLRLPTDFPRPEIQTYQGGRQKSTLKRSLLDSLETLSRREGCSLFMTLLAAFNTLLHRLTRQEDIVVGVPVAGRSRPETEGLIGFFVNTLALRNKISGNPTFLTLLRNVRDVALDAFAHQELPFDKLVEELNPERSLSHTPLFQVALNVWALPPYKPHLPDLSVEAVTRSEAQSKFDLTLYAWEEDRGFTLSLVYNASLFGQTRMAEFVRQLQCLLEQITLDPTKPISSYSLVTPQFKSLLPDPTTELPEPFYEPVPRQFVRQVQRTPDHPAICQGRHTWKYQELYDSARQSAWALIESGVERGEVVAVTGPKSYGLVASMMGVLMSGGVFLSLDPNLPPNRQRLLIQESHARRILCIGQLGQDDDWMRRATPGGILSVNSDTGEVQGVPRISNWDSQDLPLLSPNDPAYIFFTSGTSGLPKGVLGCHKGVSHFLTWQQTTFAVGPQDRCAQLTNLSFDVVLRDIFLPLISGATLCLPEAQDAEQVLEWLDCQRITILHVVPSIAESWLAKGTKNVSLEPLRCVFFAGEMLTDTLVRRWRDAFRHPGQLINFYGPTETTMVKCFYEVPSELPAGALPVGRPLPETQALILTEDRQMCGLGEPGEIVLRTPFRTLGYINAHEEQLKRFTVNPFRNDSKDVVYYTGDQGRYLPDGSLEVLGRLDDQVKIRGVRIEPAEVAAVLSQHPNVRSCIVVATKNGQMEDVLVAYVVPWSLEPTTSAELKSLAGRQLPSAMVPATIVFLPELPLLPNGKVNRSSLPVPEWENTSSPNPHTAPRNPLEEAMAEVWCQSLGLKQVGIHDNFFDLGGHSLLAMKLTAKMSSVTGRDISVRSLFLYPSIADLADAITSFPRIIGEMGTKEAPLESGRGTVDSTERSSLLPSAAGPKIERRSLLSLFGTGKIAPVDAAAVTYLPNWLLTDSVVTKDEVIDDWYQGLPVLTGITETSLGRIGIIVVPRFEGDIYENGEDLANLIVEAMELARRIGARAVSLTGLIPSATAYGDAIASRINGRRDFPKLTTGHATTAATVVLAIRRILEESRRDLTRERVGFLGLGSIGMASLQLMLKCLPHPAEIILCDFYNKLDALEFLKKSLVEETSFNGLIRTAVVTSRVPLEFYEASLIVGATNVPEVLDMTLVKKGSLIVDDSGPHCFNIEHAVQRFLKHGDILITEGGVLKSPEPVTELRHVDRWWEQRAPEFYGKVFSVIRPHRITGCVLSSLLSARFEDLEPTLGLVNVSDALKHYERLADLGFSAFDLHCGNYLMPQEAIDSFCYRFGSGAGKNGISLDGAESINAKAARSAGHQ